MKLKVFLFLSILLLVKSNAFAQLNEFVINPQPGPELQIMFASYPDKAAIMIYSDIEGVQYESNTDGIFKIVTDDAAGKVTLIIYPERQFIQIKKRGFLEGLIHIQQIKQQQVLCYKIEAKNQTDKHLNVTIITDPSDANIYLNDKLKGSGTVYELPPGQYKLRVSKEGFQDTDTLINVTKQDIYFKIKLQNERPVLLTVTSTPKDAMVLVNEEFVGNTNLQIFKLPGKYRIKVIKSGYLPIEEEIEFSLSTPLIKDYNLINNTGTLNISVHPSDCRVSLNNKEMTQLTNVKLVPGSYEVEISRRGYFSMKEPIDIELNKTINKIITLQGKTGTLQIIMQPLVATGELKFEGKTIKTFTGNQLFTELIEGDYELNLKAPRHISLKKPILIKHNERTILRTQLTPGSDVEQELVLVKGGTFEMGNKNGFRDEKPVHSVTLSEFYISKYEVTQGLWRNIMGDNPSKFTGDDKLPVENVTWYDAIEFCNKLSEWEGLQKVFIINGSNVTLDIKANGYRLPTEAEWEYAARGSSLTKGYMYSGSNNANEVAWYAYNSKDKTHPVGEKQPNELGIFDMSGNVSEWCLDMYGDYDSMSQVNPISHAGLGGLTRGGNISDASEYITLSKRFRALWHEKSGIWGFRIVRSK